MSSELAIKEGDLLTGKYADWKLAFLRLTEYVIIGIYAKFRV